MRILAFCAGFFAGIVAPLNGPFATGIAFCVLAAIVYIASLKARPVRHTLNLLLHASIAFAVGWVVAAILLPMAIAPSSETRIIAASISIGLALIDGIHTMAVVCRRNIDSALHIRDPSPPTDDPPKDPETPAADSSEDASSDPEPDFDPVSLTPGLDTLM